MGHDLESLLSATGIGDMAGKRFEKSASDQEDEPFNLQKIAAECRAAASATVEHREIRGRELVEKTATVAVISKTIDEINAIVGDPVEKIANDPNAAEFVAEALNRGHSPEEVASFLKTAGIAGYVASVGKGARASARHRAGQRLTSEGRKVSGLADREMGGLLRQAERGGDLNAQNRLVRRLRRRLGDKDAARVLKSSGAKLDVPEARDLASSAPGASFQIGAKKRQFSEAQVGKAKKIGKYTAAGGAGMAVAGRGRNGDSSKRN